jgi:hypothetical protein
MMFEKYKNIDGKTYNGVAMMSELTGISQEEIAWTATRIKQLIHQEGKTKDEAVAIVREEGKSKPWIQK